jgi:steroid delta-isomerase-like uncharacterized protein
MPSDPTQANPLVRTILDVFNSHRVEAFDALLTDDCVLFRDGAEARGREAIKRVFAQLFRAIPDIEYRIEDAVSSGDKTALRWQGRGTHRGDYLGLPATGSAMSYVGMSFLETRGDRIARMWVSTNVLERLRSLVEAARSAPAQPAALH